MLKVWDILGVIFLAVVALILCIPRPDPIPYSRLLYSQGGTLLHADLTVDGQLRFPPLADSIPIKFKTCLLAAEDGYFYYHAGVNPISLVKAVWQNVQAGHFVRGGSTLTMQLARMRLGHRQRSITAKIIEMAAASKWEITEGKENIVRQYAALAPFGGNTVGLGAAAWRYFGRNAAELTWGVW